MSDVEVILETCQKAIHKKSIRVQEFFVDFDRLRSGVVHPNHFISALGIAGIDKSLGEGDLNALKERYIIKKEGCPDFIDYKAFCEDVNVKVVKNVSLKKSRSLKTLTEDEEARVSMLLQDVSENCRKRGLLVKPMFVDFANSNNSTKLVGHVTQHQFHRTMDVKLGMKISEEDVKLLCTKYSHPDYQEMVNYVQFSQDVIPDEKPYNPYTDV